MRNLTGLDAKVAAFLEKDDAAREVLDQFKAMLSVMFARMKIDGRPYLTLAFGCTGGKHRSVWAAAHIAKWVEAEGYRVRLEHRELAKIAE